MIRKFTISAFCILLAFSAIAQKKKQLKWYINYNEVTEQATKENKLVLILFHGSNWCPPCIKMQNEVFSADTFITEYSGKILFLDIDFRTKPKLSDEQLAHNKEVKKKFRLSDDFTQGYPQVVIINGKGEILYQEKGYDGRGPWYLMEKIKSLLK